MPKDEERDLLGPVPLAQALPKPPSRIKRRLIESSVLIEGDDPDSITYMHTVFCQTGLPYRNPGPNVREWNRRQGNAFLTVEAGRALHPEEGFVKLSLHLRGKTPPHPLLPQQPSSEDQLADDRGGGHPHGVRKAARARLHGSQHDPHQEPALVPVRCHGSPRHRRRPTSFSDRHQDRRGVRPWFPKDARQCVLWPSVVQLSRDYFESLQKHAVPLDERALAALAHSALALDVYAWLAQRLHRIDPGKPQFVTWAALKEQFGPGYSRLRAFRADFKQTLDAVLTQYRAARVEVDDRGMTLHRSQPPVLKGPMLISRR